MVDLGRQRSGVCIPPGGGVIYLHTRVYGRADGTAEGVPNLVIEPLGEPFPTVVVQVLGGSEVKVGIEFVDD